MESVYTASEIKKFLHPLVKKIISLQKKNKTVIIGIQGGQGTGKTTLVRFLSAYLKKKRFKVQSFSIDDFYKTYQERRILRKKYPNNYFYQIPRGMPGTHRVKFLLRTLRQIKAGQPFEIPLFDKSLHHAQGDVLKETIKVKKCPDFVFFEGWCLGLPAVSSKVLIEVCRKNNLDLKKIDPSLNDYPVVLRYTIDYQLLWNFIDYWVMLRPQSSDLHKKWRYQQEVELKKKTGTGMTRKEIDWFVEPYLPFTYICYELVKADRTFLINEKHRIYGIG